MCKELKPQDPPIVYTQKDAEMMIGQMDKPAEPNEALKKAFERFKEREAKNA